MLAKAVIQDQHNPVFDILAWTIEPFSHQKIIDTTGGLFLLSGLGQGNQNTRSWSIVVKMLNNPNEYIGRAIVEIVHPPCDAEQLLRRWA
jgi:hypothetical protein